MQSIGVVGAVLQHKKLANDSVCSLFSRAKKRFRCTFMKGAEMHLHSFYTVAIMHV
jgi:hypothetical protein